MASDVRDRELAARTRKRTLVAVHGRLSVTLKPSVEGRDALGKSYVQERPIRLQFDGYTCSSTTDGRPLDDPEVLELIEASPAFRGSPVQPKVMAWEGDPLTPWNRQMPVQTIRGAIGAGPKPVQAPHPEWDTLEPDALRGLINEGTVNIQRAIHWEADHRRRPAVMLDLAEAMGRGVAGPDVVDDPEVFAIAATPEVFGPPMIGG
jgi:hypothetical protein